MFWDQGTDEKVWKGLVGRLCVWCCVLRRSKKSLGFCMCVVEHGVRVNKCMQGEGREGYGWGCHLRDCTILVQCGMWREHLIVHVSHSDLDIG